MRVPDVRSLLEALRVSNHVVVSYIRPSIVYTPLRDEHRWWSIWILSTRCVC